MTEPTTADHRDLASFGYRQSLHRTLGRFSAFAAGFSYISILTGMFQMFHLGFAAGGPAFFWTWPTVFLGQFLVALCFAELAGEYPLSGGVYQWSKHVGSPALGWLAGWVYLACLIVTLAAVALALQTTLPQISEHFQIIGSASDATDQARNAVLLGCILLVFSTIVSSFGVHVLARINNVGVFTELTGVILLVIFLLMRARRGPESFLTDTQHKGAGSPLGYFGPFWAAAGLTASYIMYGYDTAGSLAEETRDPKHTAPRAILQALSAAALAGGLLLLAALMAADDLNAPELADENGGLPFLVKQTLGDGLGKVFLCDVILAITVCTLAVHTGVVRLIFAMARDNQLPFGGPLSRVSKMSRTPVVPAIVAGLLAALILIANVDYPNIIKVVTAVAILWANLAYLLVTGARLRQRWRQPSSGKTSGFPLGRWGLPVNLLAVIWCTITVINVGWPRAEVYGDAWHERFGGIILTIGLLLFGVIYYSLVQRHRGGVRIEHRADLLNH
ncbi:MAG TPA: amino acid permease [Gemmataceae bacterium]|jgi:urea carboxylase system permease|nr:amino acid permease [Gemmataceae bacterium]